MLCFRLAGGTSLDFDLDGHHVVVVLEDWRGARISPPSLLGPDQGADASVPSRAVWRL